MLPVNLELEILKHHLPLLTCVQPPLPTLSPPSPAQRMQDSQGSSLTTQAPEISLPHHHPVIHDLLFNKMEMSYLAPQPITAVPPCQLQMVYSPVAQSVREFQQAMARKVWLPPEQSQQPRQAIVICPRILQ